MKKTLLLLSAVLALGSVACQRSPDATLTTSAPPPAPSPTPPAKKGIFEKAGEKMDAGLHKTGEGLQKAGDKIEEGFDKAGEKLKNE